ncbi:MAG: SigB/SigF/SigG family RNA polymerase sigma factor [Acetivibrionales bacterium]|jgi:RNA polymerase sigma-B factor
MADYSKSTSRNEPADMDALFEKYARERDVEVRNEIVKKHMYLAEIISRKFLNRGVDYDDIYQVACVALIKAVERFDPGKGFKFASFATPTIVGEIKRYFRDKSSTIRMPRRIYETYQKVNQAKDHLLQKLGRTPRADEIADYLNIGTETVLEIIESWNAFNIQSFDRNAYEEDDMELYETIGDVDSTYERIENKDFLEKSLDKFNTAEKEFIDLRYFKRKTQKEIADRMGVSQMYVSRLERKILQRFRSMLHS